MTPQQNFLDIAKRFVLLLVGGVHLSLTHHYRGSKMALWLELLPKLHKSDHLDARYHQLDDFDNLTSFEAEGTRHTARSDLLTTTTSERPAALTQARTVPTTPLASSTTTSSTTTTTTTTSTASAGSVSSSSSSLVGQQYSLSTDTSAVSLSITVAVGSFLLFVNILVFVAVYYQKDRIRRERRRHKADLRAAASQQLNYRHDDVDGIIPRTDSLSSDVRSNLSLPYGYTSTDVVDYPPAARNARSNHHHHHQYPGGVTLPRLTSPPAVVDAPAYGTVRGRSVPRWSTTSDQVELTSATTTSGLHTYSENVGHNGGLGQKLPVMSTTMSGHAGSVNSDVVISPVIISPMAASGVVTLDDSRKPSTVV